MLRVCPPALEALVKVSPVHFSLFHLAREFLHLPTHPHDGGMGQLLDDPPGREQVIPDFQESKSTGQLYDLRLFLIQRNLQFSAYILDKLHERYQKFLVMVDDISIIHITAIASYTAHFLDEVIQAVSRRQREYLADLAAEAHANISEGVNEVFRQGDDPLIGEFPMQNTLYQFMRYAVKEFAEIEGENVTFRAVLAIVFPQVLGHAIGGEHVALVLHARAVVVDELAAEHGDQRIVAKTALHHALFDVHAANVPRFPTLENVKFPEAFALEFTFPERFPRPEHIQRRLGDILLYRGFPGNVTAGHFVGFVKMVEGEYPVEIITRRKALGFLCRPPRFPPLIPSFPAFFAGHFFRHPLQKRLLRPAVG